MPSSPTKAELLILFRRNSGLIDDLRGIGSRIGRTSQAVHSDLKDLAELGVLDSKKIGASEVYALNKKRDAELQEVVAKYFRNLTK